MAVDNDAIEYWKKNAEENYKSAQALFSTGRYVHSLFFYHFMIESILKALIVKRTFDHPPAIHNLIRLSELTGLPFSQEQLDNITEVNSFNLRARYDDYKLEFYKKATKEYTEKYQYISNELYLWLNEQF